MTYHLEHRMTWPLGDAWLRADDLKPHEKIYVDVEGEWDPSDDTVTDPLYSFSTEHVSQDQAVVMIQQVRTQLTVICDSAMTEAIDNAKRERAVS